MLMTLNYTRLAPLPNSMICVIDCLFFTDDIKGCPIKNKLKLSEDKTEAMVLGKLSVLSGISRDSIVFAGCQIPLASRVRSLGVTLDSAMSMKQ